MDVPPTRHFRYRLHGIGVTDGIWSIDLDGASRDRCRRVAVLSAPSTLAGRLLYSRFTEATHTFDGMFAAAADGSSEVPVPMPWTEGGGRWSSSGEFIAVPTQVEDGRVGTAILDEAGNVVRVLDIPDETLNLPCTAWSPDDKRLACTAWDDADPTRGGIYTVRAKDGGDLVRLTTPPAGMADFR